MIDRAMTVKLEVLVVAILRALVQVFDAHRAWLGSRLVLLRHLIVHLV